MSEAKAAAEAAARTYSKAQVATVKTLGSIRRAAATPATARAMATETRALAKVFPQEARAVAKDLREDAKHMTSIQARRKRQAPPARLVAAPPPTAVVARAAAKNPVPVSVADIKKFFGITIPKPAVAALTPEQFFGGAKAAAAEVPFSSSSSSAPKAAAGGAGGPPGPAADAAAHRKTEEETVRHFKDALFALGEVFAKRLSYGVGGKGKVINRKVNVKLDQPGYWDEISPLAGYTVRVFSGESGPGRPSDFATANFRIDHEGGVHIMVTPYSDHSDTDVAMPAILQDLYLVGLGRELLTKGDSVKVIENDTTAMKGAIDSLRAFLAVGRPTKVEHTKFGYGSDKDSSNIIQFTMPAQTVGNTMSIHGKAMTIMSNMSEHVTVYVSATKIVIDHSWSSIYRTVTVEDTRDLTERILKNHPDTWRIVPIGTLHKHIAHLL